MMNNKNTQGLCNNCKKGNGEELKFNCKCCNESRKTLKGYLDDFNDQKKTEIDVHHQDNDYTYNTYNIKPCKNINCCDYIELKKNNIIQYW